MSVGIYQGYREHFYAPQPDNPFSWTLLSGGSDALITQLLGRAKKQAHIYDNHLDDQVRDFIEEAVEYIERTRDTQLLTAQWKLTYDRWPLITRINPFGAIIIPKWPVQSVQSVQYVDPAGMLQTWDPSQWTADVKGPPCRIQAAYGCIWPFLQSIPQAVQITLTLGYGDDASSIPALMRRAICMWATHADAQRGDQYAEDRSTAYGIDTLLGASHWGSTL
jgi:uncharacterized phiE125 gp8 family phage protein